MEGLDLFKNIISQARNINDLPTLDEIYQELEDLAGIDDCDYDAESDCLTDNWDGSIIILIDGTQVELIYGKTCILHSYHDFGRDYSYKINDSLYTCANCLTILVEHNDLCEKYYTYYSDSLLFPKRWDTNSVISWIRKSEKRQEEYYSTRYEYVNYHGYEGDYYEEHEDGDYENFEDYFSIDEYMLNQKVKNTIQDERENIWKQEDCQILYNRIINCVYRPATLTKAQRNQAKDMSISAIQKEKEPDYERFKKRVERDREKKLFL